MAGLAIQGLRIGAQRLIAWLGGAGAAAGGAVVLDEASRRQQAADDARSTPIARSDAGTRQRDACKRCPLCKGSLTTRSTAGWSEVSIAYQLRIGGLALTPAGIQEWSYNGVSFDGVDLGACVLKEAKAHYEQFFNIYGQPQAWWGGVTPIIEEAVRQDLAAVPEPPVRLEWHFMEAKPYGYFATIIGAACPTIQVHFTP